MVTVEVTHIAFLIFLWVFIVLIPETLKKKCNKIEE